MTTSETSKSRHVALTLSILLSVGILGVLAYRLDWKQLGAELSELRWAYLLPLIAITLLTLWVRALRWRHLLPNGETLSRSQLFEATAVGNMATFVLPLRMGEIIRPLVLSRWQSVKFSPALASIVVERAFDALTLMGLLGVTLSQLETVPEIVHTGAKVLTALALAVLALMVTAYFGSAMLIRLGEKTISFLVGKKFPELAKKLTGMVEGFLSGLRGISSPKDLVWSVVWSVLLWSLYVLLYQVGLWSLGLSASWWVGATICVMIALAVAAPAAPGFVGTFQLGCVIAFSLFGYSEESAVAYSIVLHALQMVTVVACGFFILNRRSLRLRDIRKSLDS